MTIHPGQEIEIAVGKPVAGGRMIARHEGQVVLVSGAIPGEQIVARVERVEKRLAFAAAVRVLSASADRREPLADLLCGGCAYAHIEYPRQVALKSEVVADAYARIGRIPGLAPVAIAPSPEAGYRMRARLHVSGGRAGFYREGTHDLCDARATGQLMPGAMAAIDAALAVLHDGGTEVASIELSENIAADQRVLHLDISSHDGEIRPVLTRVVAAAGLSGCTARTDAGLFDAVGEPRVSDPLGAVTHGRAPSGELRRGPASFFQGNRFLIADLVLTVLGAMPDEGDVLELYAGVGLFAVSLAAAGRERITAVEGDRLSGADLRDNAAPYARVLRVIIGRVEDHIAGGSGAAETILVDPPRTGLSRDAMAGIVRHGARRLVYVSCDPPTMARDARRLLDAGYGVTSLRGFDLFPNTPHVETVGVFDLR